MGHGVRVPSSESQLPPAYLGHVQRKRLITKTAFLILEILTRWCKQLNVFREIGKKRQEMEEHKNNLQTFKKGNQTCAEDIILCIKKKLCVKRANSWSSAWWGKALRTGCQNNT